MQFFDDLMQFVFLQRALLAALLASLLISFIGTYVYIKKLQSLAGAISHSILGPMGLVVYLNAIFSLSISPFVGGLIGSVIIGLALSYLTIKHKNEIESFISIFWAIGMSLGLLFIYISPGYVKDLNSYLFGDILLVNNFDLYMLSFLIGSIIILGLFYRPFKSYLIDEEFASLQGIPIKLYFSIALVLLSLGIVILSRLVGVVLVIALLSLPIATVSKITKSFKSYILGSFLVSLSSLLLGIFFAYQLNMPSSIVIALIQGIIFSLTLIIIRVQNLNFKKISKR